MPLKDPHSLHYAPAAPHRKRRWGRRAACVVLLIAGVVVSFRLAPSIRQHAIVIQAQRRCAGFVAPAPGVAYQRIPVYEGGQRRPDKFELGTVQLVPEWATLYAAVSPPGGVPSALVFLHERRSDNGTSRIVAVTFSPALANLSEQLPFSINVIEPGTPVSRPKLLFSSSVSIPSLPPESQILILAGQVDTSDSSHFTIDYVLGDGNRRTLDGWLRADDTVLLEARRQRLPAMRAPVESGITPPPPPSPASPPSADRPAPAPAPSAR